MKNRVSLKQHRTKCPYCNPVWSCNNCIVRVKHSGRALDWAMEYVRTRIICTSMHYAAHPLIDTRAYGLSMVHWTSHHTRPTKCPISCFGHRGSQLHLLACHYWVSPWADPHCECCSGFACSRWCACNWSRLGVTTVHDTRNATYNTITCTYTSAFSANMQRGLAGS